jgi:hypothetical protein
MTTFDKHVLYTLNGNDVFYIGSDNNGFGYFIDANKSILELHQKRSPRRSPKPCTPKRRSCSRSPKRRYCLHSPKRRSPKHRSCSRSPKHRSCSRSPKRQSPKRCSPKRKY